MKNNYSAPLPASQDFRDVQATALAALPWTPDGFWMDATNFWVGSDTNTLTPAQLTTWRAAVLATIPIASAPWHRLNVLQDALSGIPTILRNQAAAATGVTVTTGNNNAVTQTIVNDLVIFCARLADLLELLGVTP